MDKYGYGHISRISICIWTTFEALYDGKTKELFRNYKKLESYNLDLPYISKMALKLKEKGLIDYKELPLTLEELHNTIKEAKDE